MTLLTHEQAKELLSYCRETGLLHWRKKRWRVNPGDQAGCVNHSDGYVQIYVNQKRYAAHRLAFFIETGRWPAEFLDHINGIRDDNRWENLRECSLSENNRNKALPRHNTSGLKGICWHKAAGKWFAKIQVDRKIISLGLHDSKEQAHAAYCAAAERLHGDFARFQ